MKRLWTFTPGGSIWRVHPAVNGRIVGESRDIAARRASFFAVDIRTGKPLWRGLTLEQQWWVGMEGVRGDTLYVHGYANPTLPLHRGLTAIDIPRGSVLWSNGAWTPGAPLGEGAVGEQDDWQSSVVFPESIVIDALAGHSAGSSIVREWPATNLVGVVEVVEEGQMLIVAAMERAGSGEADQYVHHLRILNASSDRALYSDILSRTAKGISTDAFFVQDGLLVYVREGEDLCAVDIRHRTGLCT